MFPVFSLVLDQDVKPEVAMLYPELYKDLTKVRRRLRPANPPWAYGGHGEGGAVALSRFKPCSALAGVFILLGFFLILSLSEIKALKFLGKKYKMPTLPL